MNNRSANPQNESLKKTTNKKEEQGNEENVMVKDKDEELDLFLEVRKREKDFTELNLLRSSLELDVSPGSKCGSSPLLKILTSLSPKKTGEDDFLNSENDKNDYDWLLTPPGTPLFPSLEKESPKTDTSQIATPKARPTALRSRLANSQLEPASRSNFASRQPISSPGSNSSLAGVRRPSSSGSTGSLPATPTGRNTKPHSAISSRPATPTSRITARSSKAITPTPRSRSSAPTARSPVPSARSSVQAAKSSIPSGRSSAPATRSSTPSARSSTLAARSSTPSGRSSAPATRSSTPSARSSTLAARSSTPSARSSTAAARSTPSGRSAIQAARSSSPSARSSTPATRSSIHSARSSTPAARPIVPASRSMSRSATPTRRSSTLSTVSSVSKLPGQSSLVTKSVPTTTRNPTPSRVSSPAMKSRMSKPSERPNMSVDPPLNLRTSLAQKSVYASRGRPGEPSVRHASVEGVSSGSLRQQSCSPSRGRPPNGSSGKRTSVPAVKRTNFNGTENISPVLIGTKMVERAMNMRKLAPPKQDEQQTTKQAGGFGRTLSKKSLDMALRHMDIRRSGSSNLRPSLTDSVRSGPGKR